MKKIINRAAIAVATVLLITFVVMLTISILTSRPVYNDDAPSDLLSETNIYAADTALTFARFPKAGAVHLLLVRSFKDSIVRGIDLTDFGDKAISDPVDFFNLYGYEGICALIKEDYPQVNVDVESLLVPADFHTENIAVGFNYKAHADEVNQDEDPFLFPKKRPADPFNYSLSIADYKLPDYELELGVVTLEDITKDSKTPEYIGLLLTHDFSDRWPIVRNHINRMFGAEEKPSGIRGYPEAKNRPHSLPVGNFFLIPKDYQTFYPNLTLKLYRNNKLRQVANTSLLVWKDLDTMIDEIFKRVDWEYEHNDKTLNLLSNLDLIKKRTIILTGTPEGVIVKPTNWWNRSLFLKAGEEVVLYSEGFGFIRNLVVE